MKIATLSAVAIAVLLGGCSGGSGLTTGSVAGAGAGPGAPAEKPVDVAGRAMQVGAVAARAQKCGYNFDPVKLKSNFLASEARINPADIAKAEKIYDVAYNGVMKAVAAKPDYCTETKTAEIKEDLTRHLTGDYNPRVAKAEVAEPGFFDKWGDGNGNEKGAKFGTSDWWDSQAEKKGG